MSQVTPLKLAIVASGRTQKEIAAAAGLDPTHMSRLANGLRCDEDTRRKIARVLGRGVGELWPGHDAASNHTSERPDPSDAEKAAA